MGRAGGTGGRWRWLSVMSADAQGRIGVAERTIREVEPLPVLRTDGVTKTYRDPMTLRPFTAVTGLSLTLNRGEIFGLLGPNGAGKTTTIKLVLGLARPTGGSILVDGRVRGTRGPAPPGVLAGEPLLLRSPHRRGIPRARGLALRPRRAHLASAREDPPGRVRTGVAREEAAPEVLQGDDPAVGFRPGAPQRADVS